MLVYDITNERSFENIKNWIRNIEEVEYTVACLLDAWILSLPYCLILASCSSAGFLERCGYIFIRFWGFTLQQGTVY